MHNGQEVTPGQWSVQSKCLWASLTWTLGPIYSEYSYAIREGDGDQVLRCWKKYFLVLFKESGKKNYACEAIAFLACYQLVLSPPSHGTSTPLVMVHQCPWKKRERTFLVIFKWGIWIVSSKMESNQTRRRSNIGTSSSYYKPASSDKDLQQLVTELVVNTPFTEMKRRKLKRFKLTSLMNSLKEDVMKTWRTNGRHSLLDFSNHAGRLAKWTHFLIFITFVTITFTHTNISQHYKVHVCKDQNHWTFDLFCSTVHQGMNFQILKIPPFMLWEHVHGKFGINQKCSLWSIIAYYARFSICVPVKYFFGFAQATAQKFLGNDIIEWCIVM